MALGLMIEVIGVVLIALGAALVSVADELLFVVCALFLQYLGSALLLLSATGRAAGVVALIVGVGSLAILGGGQALRTRLNGRSAPRSFDLSVVALAIVGAIGLAVTHPPLPNLPADVAIGMLVLTGLLFCLLGGAARIVGGLIFLSSGAGLLLQTAEPGLRGDETVLLAASQLALVVALSVLWTVGEDRDALRPRRRRTRRRVVSDNVTTEPGSEVVS